MSTTAVIGSNDIPRYNGQTVTIIRPLDPTNPDDHYEEEVGPMFRVKAQDGSEFDVFKDELIFTVGADS